MSRTLRPALSACVATTLAAALSCSTVLPATALPATSGDVTPASTVAAASAAAQPAAEPQGENQQVISVTGVAPEALPAGAGGEGRAAAEAPSSVTSSSPSASSSPQPSGSAGSAADAGDAGDSTAVVDEGEAAELAKTALPGEDGVDALAALTRPTETIDFVIAGLTWDREDTGTVTEASVRVREGGQWTGWESLEILAGDENANTDRTGTEPLVTTGANAIQVRVITESGEVPSGLEIDLIHPGEAETDGQQAAASPATASPAGATGATAQGVSAQGVPTGDAASAAFAPALHQQQGPLTGTAEGQTVATRWDNVLKPAIITRAQWGADESLASDSTANKQLKAMYVHHTAGTNNYTRAQAYQQIRGIYQYHAGSLRWGDIGYQFLVDKFGNIYEGRRGSIQGLTVGAQAGGFNTDTLGVSAMGNYDVVDAPAVMVDAIERVLAWKAYQYDIDATGRTTLTSRASSASTAKYAYGRQANVPTILGHRDTNYTACPGRYLYADLPSIRQDVKAKVTAAKNAQVQKPATPGASSNPYSLLAPGMDAMTRWGAAAGERYQIMYRAVPHGGGSLDSQPWLAGRTTAGTSLKLGTEPGESAQFAVRSITGDDASSQRYLGQHTGPLSWADPTIRTSGMTVVNATQGVEKKGLKSTRAGSVLRIEDAAAANRLVLGARAESGTVRVRVEKDGTNHGTLLFTPGSTKYRGIDLPTGGAGTIRLIVQDARPIIFTAAAVTRPGQTADGVAAHRADCGPQFKDNKPGSAHFTAIQWMACEAISVGYADNTFRKYRDITRGETAQLIYRMAAVTRPATGQSFKDVTATYADAVDWFADEGISVGYTDGTFRPGQAVTRGELAAFLYRLADPSGYRAPTTSPFKDLSRGSTHYEAITWLHSQDVTAGYGDGTYKPRRPINRAETAALLEAYYDGPLQLAIDKIHG